MAYSFENTKINPRIRTGNLYNIHGMQDAYMDVVFRYHKKSWNGSIPIVSKYQGLNIPLVHDDVITWVAYCYNEVDPGKNVLWQNNQKEYWAGQNAYDTQSVFEALNGLNDLTNWQCRKCGPVPQTNPQSAARIKSLKQRGYYIATKKMDCASCGNMQFFDLLIRLPRHSAENEKRYSLPFSLQKRIKEVLPLMDLFDRP